MRLFPRSSGNCVNRSSEKKIAHNQRRQSEYFDSGHIIDTKSIVYNSFISESLRKYLYLKEEWFLQMTFGILSFLLISGLLSGIRLITLILFIFSLAIYWKLKDYLSSIIITFLYSLQLFYPNKYYEFEAIRSFELVNYEYERGFIEGYGLNISNVFLILVLIVIVRTIIIEKGSSKKITKALSESSFFKFSIFGMIFFTTAILSSYLNSPSIELSFLWSVQYMQYLLVPFVMLCFFVLRKKKFYLLFQVIAASTIFQFFLSIIQFIKQSYIGLTIESGTGGTYAQGYDEVNAIFRVSGSVWAHNQLALICLVFLAFFLPDLIRKVSYKQIILPILLVLPIILTQSRSIWIASVLVGLYFLKMFGKEIKAFIDKKQATRIFVLILFLFSVISYVFIPRIVASINAPFEGAGIPVRLKLLEEGWEAFLQSPLIGFGVGMNEYTLFRLFPKGVTSGFPAAVHFAYLQMMLEVGILGAISFWLPLVVMLFSFKKIQHPYDYKKYLFAFRAGLLAFVVYYLFLPHFGIMDFAYLGLVIGFGFIAKLLVL